MLKITAFVIFSLFLFTFSLSPVFARTTPQDIVDSQLESYNARIQNYSAPGKQKLTDWNKKIKNFNEEKSAELEQICVTQGMILDEFIRRNDINEKAKTDGKTRNLSDPIENARYWITFAHEAAAYQKAHVYVFSPTGEANINRDILSTINQMNSDLNVLKGKVQKSQNLVADLVNKNDI